MTWCRDHQWVYSGRCDRNVVGDKATCERPYYVTCAVCAARQVARCDAAREDRCEPCGKRHNRRLRRLIRSGFDGRPTGFFLATATAPGQAVTANGADAIPGGIGKPADRLAAAWWNGHAPQCWSWLITEMRRQLGDVELEYWKCWETQKRGLLHVHAILWAMGVTEQRMREVWESALAHVYGVEGGVWGWGPKNDLQRIGTTATVQSLMEAHDFTAEEAAAEWENLEGASIGHAAMYGAKYCTKGGKRAVSLNRKTGEMRNDGRGYRTWSASVNWGQRMKSIRAEQRAWRASGVVPPPGGAAPPPLDTETDFYATGEDAATAIVDLLGAITV